MTSVFIHSGSESTEHYFYSTREPTPVNPPGPGDTRFNPLDLTGGDYVQYMENGRMIIDLTWPL